MGYDGVLRRGLRVSPISGYPYLVGTSDCSLSHEKPPTASYYLLAGVALLSPFLPYSPLFFLPLFLLSPPHLQLYEWHMQLATLYFVSCLSGSHHFAFQIHCPGSRCMQWFPYSSVSWIPLGSLSSVILRSALSERYVGQRDAGEPFLILLFSEG